MEISRDDNVPAESDAALQPEAQTLLLPTAEDEEEEEDEPIIVRTDTNRSDQNILRFTVDESATFEEPVEHKQVTDILLAKEDTDKVVELELKAPADAAIDLGDCSIECKEALDAVLADPWDISSSMVFLEEVVRGRGGKMATAEAYELVLRRFPRAAKLWKSYAEHIYSSGDVDGAEAVLARGTVQCWSVDLWLSYVSISRNKYMQLIHAKASPEACAAQKAQCEAAHEAALEQVGWAVDSFHIWRSHLDFLSLWPESDPLEASKKISAIRKVYQRVLCTPVDGADMLWRDYETLERSRNEMGADSALQDLVKKHQHSRSILRDRRKLTSGIVFDRFATPPSNTAAEQQQLEQWSAWISFELACPDYLNIESWRVMVRMVFQQCLTCFYHHPEVWLAFTRFEQQQAEAGVAGAAAAARDLLVQGITANPQSSVLRVALADFEEAAGREDNAKEVLRAMFQAIPTGFTFSLYQRFVRRTLGIHAARKLFTETATLRLSDPRLCVDLYSAHAALELDVNCQPVVTLRVLDAVLEQQTLCLHSFRFLRLYVRALLQTGDLPRLRFVMQCALEAAAGTCTSPDGSVPPASALAALLAPPPILATGRISKAHVVPEAALRRLLMIYDLYLRAEVTLGRGDLLHLERLRDQRQRVRLILEDSERSKDESAARPSVRKGLFDAATEALERCDHSALLLLPDEDSELRDRCRGRTQTAPPRLAALVGSKRDRQAMLSADFHLGMGGLPVQLRELLVRLPGHTGPPPDIDAFVRHMKSVTLPPRPTEEADPRALGGAQIDDWVRPDGAVLDEARDEAAMAADCDPRLFDEREEDVFRQRQRQRLV